MSPLSPKRRSELRSEAHKLSPIVLIGDKGLTDEVVTEIDRSLRAHELVKVRAATDDRKARDEWLRSICDRLAAHPVQQIGKVFVIYREKPAEEPEPRPAAAGEGRRRPRAAVVGERGKARQRSRDADKRRAKDVADMVRKGKIRLDPGVRRDDEGARDEEVKRTSRPRSRTPSPRPESGPRRRRPRTSR